MTVEDTLLLKQIRDSLAGLAAPTIAPGDVEIGAVEIKDGTTDARALVGAGNAAAASDIALTVADANTLAKLTAIDGHVDGLEGLVGATNTALATTNAGLASIDSHVDGLEATNQAAADVLGTAADAAVTTNAVGTLSSKLRGMVTHLLAVSTVQGTTADAVDLVGVAGTNSSKLRGLVQLTVSVLAAVVDLSNRSGREVLDRWTRPADVTAYTIGDLLRATTNDSGTTGLRPLALARANGKGFFITHFSVRFKKTDFLPTIRVHMWLIPNPATAGGGAAVIPGDNAVFSLTDANIPTRIGSFDLPACTLGHAADDYTGAATDTSFRYQVQPTDSSIYYAMEIIGGASITPSSAMQVSVLGRSVDL